VLPFFGPSSFRDGPARMVEIFLDPIDYIGPRREVISLWVTRTVDGRSRLVSAEKVLEGAALDKYSFMRDSWIQRRRNQIYDGNPPLPPEEDFDD
jgi:phospholipid-binding lipoprotein MlaA